MNFGTEFRTRKPASENIFYDLMSLKLFFVRFLRVFHSLFSHFQWTAERNIRVHRQKKDSEDVAIIGMNTFFHASELREVAISEKK